MSSNEYITSDSFAQICTTVSKNTEKKPSLRLNDSGYFLLDPALWRDTLPQPYRMVDKIQNDLLDSVWSVIEHRKNVKESQGNSMFGGSPPMWASNETIQVPRINSCSGCNGSSYISLGTRDGLYIVDSALHEVCATCKTENSEIQTVNQYYLDPLTCLITTLDDVGTARVFAYKSSGNLVLILTVSEQSEGKLQSFVTYCAASPQGDYFGAVMDGSVVGKETYLDIYKLSVNNLFDQFEPKTSSCQIATDISASNETSFLRISSPSVPQACRIANLYQASKLVDSTGDVIGSGYSHLLSKNYFEARASFFRYNYSDLMQYLPEKESLQRDLNFKFVQRDLTVDPARFNENTTPSILVWSYNSRNISRYSLMKIKKDSEPPDPDTVWPFAAAIKIVAISLCTTWIAVGLENGFVSIWDNSLGISSGVFDLSQDGCVKDLRFLSINSSPNNEQPDSVSCHLIAVLHSGLVQYFTFTDGSFTINTVLSAPKFPEAAVNKVTPISGKNQLLLMTFNNSVIVLMELTKGQTVCQLKLPNNYNLLPIWDPIVATVEIKPDFTDDDTMSLTPAASYVYVNGSVDDSNDIHMNENSSFVIFQLDTIPALETFYKEEVNIPISIARVSETSLESLVENTLKMRMDQQRQRNIRLKSQWENLPSLIQQNICQ